MTRQSSRFVPCLALVLGLFIASCGKAEPETTSTDTTSAAPTTAETDAPNVADEQTATSSTADAGAPKTVAAADIATETAAAPSQEAPVEQPTPEPQASEKPDAAVVKVDETPRPPATVAEAAKWLDLRTFPLVEGTKLSGERRQVGELNYDAPGPLQAAFDFQRKALEDLGWQLLPDGRLDGDNPMADFTQHGFLVSVSVSNFSQVPDHVSVWIKNHGNVLPATLPVPVGVEPFYSMRSSASYITTNDTAETADAVWKLLIDKGWQPYGGGQDFRLFKQNAILLNANVMAHPAQPGKTFVTYTTEQLSADIPAPPEVADPRYTDSMKRMDFDHEGIVPDAIAEFYNTELGKLGWKPTSKPVGDDPITVVYRNDEGEMMTLEMQLFNDLTRVNVEHFTAAEVAALNAQVKEAAALAQQEEAERAAAEEARMATTIGLPVPADASDVKQDEDNRRVRFSVASGAGKELFTAYTKYFKDQGWDDDVSSITENFGIIDFEKDDFTLEFEFEDLGLGGPAKVTVESKPAQLVLDRRAQNIAAIAGLSPAPTAIPTPDRGVAATDTSTPEAKPSETAAKATGGRLLAEEVAVPKAATDVERDPDTQMVIYRSDLSATKLADFFRKAMSKAGWSEIKDETFVDDDLGFGGVNFEKGDLYVNLSIQNGKPDSTSRVLVMGDGIQWPGDEEPVGDDSKPMEEEKVAAEFVGTGECKGAVYLGDKKFDMKYALVALRRGDDDEHVTKVYVSAEPFSKGAVDAVARDDVSIFELFGAGLPECLDLTIEKSYTSIFAFVDGTSVNLGGDKVKSAIKTTDARATGRVYMDEPDDVFDKPFRFDVTIDVELTSGDEIASEPLPGGLAVDDRQSMLVPRGTSELSQGGSPYMKTLHALVDARLADVLTFYRTELANQGWQEDADAASEAEKSASLSYKGDEGELTLKIGRRRGETLIDMTIRKTSLARQQGVVPAEGKALLMLGNATEAEIEFTIDGKPQRLAAGQGGNDPADAVKVPIEPGEHTVKVAGADAEKFEVPAGATWGVIAIPGGGVFADRVY